MRFTHSILLVFLIVLFTGCDIGYGVSRRGKVAFMPEPATVGAVIRDTPGVDEVRYFKKKGSRPLKFTGIKPSGAGSHF